MTPKGAGGLNGRTFRADKPCRANHDSDSYVYSGKCVECVRIKNANYKRAIREERAHRARTAFPNMTDSNLRQAAAKGVEKSRAHGDRRHEPALTEVNSFLALPPVPDFLARAEERIQAARAGR